MSETLLSPAARLGMELVATGNIIRRSLSRKVAGLGLQDGEWGILVHLLRSGEGISQKELARRLGNEPHAVVRVLNNMEQSGLLSRLVDPLDARGRQIVLSPQGRDLAAQVIATIDDFEQQLVMGHNEAQLIGVIAILHKMRLQLTSGEG